jgi:hypothetical protein
VKREGGEESKHTSCEGLIDEEKKQQEFEIISGRWVTHPN